MQIPSSLITVIVVLVALALVYFVRKMIYGTSWYLSGGTIVVLAAILFLGIYFLKKIRGNEDE